jgi:hypothetical protein
MIEYWHKKFTEKAPAKDELFGPSGIYKTTRSIYYDTDNIREVRQEFVHYCPDCQGIYQVISESEKQYGQDYRMEGISIPIYACRDCLKKGYELWESVKKKRDCDLYFLQDKKGDCYLTEKSK